MSTSLLYHAFNIKSVKYRSTRYIGNTIVIKAEMIDKTINCPVCHGAGSTFAGQKTRMFHFPPIGRKRGVLELILHRLHCKNCAHKWWPRLSFMVDSKRYTRAFAHTAIDLLKFGTIQAVAKYLKVGWDMIKDIHKNYLQSLYKKPSLQDVVYLGIDEFSIRKGHSYMTICVDLLTGRIIHAVEGKSTDAIKPFLKRIRRYSPKLKAVAIDMSHSYRKAVQECLPHVSIVYDHYHISALINRSVDDLRREQQRQLCGKEKQALKGSRFLLLRNYGKLDPDAQQRLQLLLDMNKPLFSMYTMKEQLRQFWECRNRQEARKYLWQWCFDALTSGVKQLVKVGLTLNSYREDILNYFDHPITNAVTEGINNKIKTLKRQAYGYRDMEYFKLRLYHLHTQRYALSG